MQLPFWRIANTTCKKDGPSRSERIPSPSCAHVAAALPASTRENGHMLMETPLRHWGTFSLTTVAFSHVCLPHSQKCGVPSSATLARQCAAQHWIKKSSCCTVLCYRLPLTGCLGGPTRPTVQAASTELREKWLAFSWEWGCDPGKIQPRLADGATVKPLLWPGSMVNGAHIGGKES